MKTRSPPNASVYLLSMCFYSKSLHFIQSMYRSTNQRPLESITVIIPRAQVLFLDLHSLNEETGKPLFKM